MVWAECGSPNIGIDLHEAPTRPRGPMSTKADRLEPARSKAAEKIRKIAAPSGISAFTVIL